VSDTQTPADKRNETAKVETYLTALEAQQGKLARGRRTREWLESHVRDIDAKLPAASGVQRLGLIQDRLECEADLLSFAALDNFENLQQAFIKVAATYSERTGVSWQAWREVGVPVAVLNEAGVTR